MRKSWKIALLVAVFISGAVAFCQVAYPTYSYRYRLTLALEVDGKVRSGSSVIEVKFIGQPKLPDAGSFISEIRGQAAFVDLETKGVVVAALINGESYGPASDGAISALWLLPRAFNAGLSQDDYSSLTKLAGRRDLTADNMPRLIWFPDAQNPLSARKFTTSEIPSLFGASARLTAAYVEITHDPILVDIDQRLTWLRHIERFLANPRNPFSSTLKFGREFFIGKN